MSVAPHFCWCVLKMTTQRVSDCLLTFAAFLVLFQLVVLVKQENFVSFFRKGPKIKHVLAPTEQKQPSPKINHWPQQGGLLCHIIWHLWSDHVYSITVFVFQWNCYYCKSRTRTVSLLPLCGLMKDRAGMTATCSCSVLWSSQMLQETRSLAGKHTAAAA